MYLLPRFDNTLMKFIGADWVWGVTGNQLMHRRYNAPLFVPVPKSFAARN